jgi:hypothetical protein
MKPIPFKEANKVFTKPPSMTDEECSPLHVHNTGDALISCWQPSEEEREAIARGEPIWLRVHGQGHPPVSIEVGTPFVEVVIQ